MLSTFAVGNTGLSVRHPAGFHTSQLTIGFADSPWKTLSAASSTRQHPRLAGDGSHHRHSNFNDREGKQQSGAMRAPPLALPAATPTAKLPSATGQESGSSAGKCKQDRVFSGGEEHVAMMFSLDGTSEAWA